MYYAVVSSGTSRNLMQYRQPETYTLPPGKIPGDIVGMGIAGSDDHVYAWYKDGKVSSGTSRNLAQYRQSETYTLPPGKTSGDIVGMGIAGSDDHVYVWYKDGKVSSGTSRNLAQYRQPETYTLPPGKTPGDIVDMSIAGSDDHVYVWYKDGKVSSGTSRNLTQYRQPEAYTLPPGALHVDIIGMGIAGSDDHVYVWYRSKGAVKGDLEAVDWCYKIYEPPGSGQTITITFSPRIKNVGSLGWSSPKEGSYSIAVFWGPYSDTYSGKLRSYPHWMIGPGETKTLEGVTVPFHPNNTYDFPGWSFTHPDDTNSGNNGFKPGETISEKGDEFKKEGVHPMRQGKMIHKKCPKS